MSPLRRLTTLNTAQRILLVAAYGIALWVVWGWIEVEGWRQIGADSLTTSWAPSTGVVLDGANELRTNVGLRLWVQLGLIAVWIAPSLWLLRDRRSTDQDDGSGMLHEHRRTQCG